MARLPENSIIDLVVESQDTMASMFIHAFVSYEGGVDAVRLERAVALLPRRAPILACQYVAGGVAPGWTWAPAEALAGMFELRTCESEDEARRVIAGRAAEDPPAGQPPMLRALLVRWPGGDRLHLKFSHLVADGGGIKELVYLLAEAYRELGRDPRWDPGPAALGSRGLRQVLGTLGPGDWRRVIGAAAREDRLILKRGRAANLIPEDRGRPAYVDVFLDRALVGALKAQGKPSGATLNDQLLAGFARALARFEPEADRLVVPFTIDLRRYLPPGPPIVANISSIANLLLPCPPGERFEDTLALVCAETGFYKAHLPGLAAILRAAISGVLPAELRLRLMRWMWPWAADSGRISPAFTNLGIVDARKADFGDAAIANLSVSAPISRPGRLIVSATGYDGTITMHLGCQDGGDPEGSVARLGRYWREALGAAIA